MYAIIPLNFHYTIREVSSVATLDDIALELGISKGTVSKALNGAKDVSKKMQQAVLEKAVELGYSRGNRGSAQPRLAVFVINMEYTKPDDFGYDIVMGFRQAAEPAGYQVDVISLTQQMQLDYRYDAFMILNNYIGALFLGMCLVDPWITEFETCKTPTVLYDNHISCNPNVTNIGVDSTEGIELAVNYLRSLGHQNIGYLSSALEAYVYRERYDVFSRVMSRMGLPADDRVMGNSYLVSKCISLHLPRLLKNRCTAIICSHDILAHSVLVYCSELGLRVPEDISVLGYDDIPLCRFTSPPLTTIRQNRPALGKSAFYALSSHFVGVPLSTHLLHAELVQRSSCGAAPTEFRLPPHLEDYAE